VTPLVVVNQCRTRSYRWITYTAKIKVKAVGPAPLWWGVVNQTHVLVIMNHCIKFWSLMFNGFCVGMEYVSKICVMWCSSASLGEGWVDPLNPSTVHGSYVSATISMPHLVVQATTVA